MVGGSYTDVLAVGVFLLFIVGALCGGGFFGRAVGGYVGQARVRVCDAG